MLAVLLTVLPGLSSAVPPHSQCESISIPLCQEMPYNLTRVPNILGHSDQVSAALALHQLKAMLDLDCSPYLGFFLCSLHAPMCTDQVGKL